jgi:hypothetical protein
MKLRTHSNLTPMLRKNGAIPHTLPLAFMACILLQNTVVMSTSDVTA